MFAHTQHLQKTRHSGYQVGIALTGLVVAIGGRSIANLIGIDVGFRGYQAISIRLRKRFIQQQLRLTPAYHDNASLGEKQYLFLKLIDDVAVLQGEVVPSILRNVLLGLVSVCALAYLFHPFALGVLVIVPAYAYLVYLYRRRMVLTTQSAADALTELSEESNEVLGTIVPIQLLARENRHRQKVMRGLAKVYRAQKKRVRTEMQFMSMAYGINTLGSVLLLAFGCFAVFKGALSVGTLVAAYTFLNRVFEPAENLSDNVIRLQRLLTSAGQLDAFFAIRTAFLGPPTASTATEVDSIDLVDVWFRYEDKREWALRGVTLHLPAQETIGLVGKNGTGKSSLAKLIVRLYDANGGAVVIAGKPVNEWPLQTLRRTVQYLPQSSTLFSGSITANLKMGFAGPGPDMAKMYAALELVGLTDFVDALPAGLNTMLGENGTSLSGGQKQRLVLARTALMAPQVLVLDEATSALDITGEEQVLRGLREWLPLATIVVITHRISSIIWCDRMVVLESGEITAIGSHGHLIRHSPAYRDLLGVDVRSVTSSHTGDG